MNDQEHGLPLGQLDPGTADPGFWIRFHGRIMTLARGELARRRATAELTIAEVVFAWRKALVPAALMAAVLAGVFVMTHGESGPLFSPMALEEALTEDLGVEPIPTVLARDAELDEVAFLTGSGGF